jgi:hypothetical protein
MCNYFTSSKKDYNRHLKTSKHMGRNGETKKSPNNNLCEKCNKYFKSRTTLWRHKKRCVGGKIKLAKVSQKLAKVSQKKFVCDCGKSYKHKTSLSKHRKICIICKDAVKKDDNLDIQGSDDVDEIKQMLGAIIKENRELKEEVKKMKINQTINNNQKVSINLFLNQYCKNAMSLEDFLGKIQPTLEDLLLSNKIGFSGGVSNLLIKNLKNIPSIERPIHCADSKRLKFYIKDNEGWSFDKSNKKVDKAIEHVTTKQIYKIKEWEEKNPDYITNDVKLKVWQKMIQNVTGPTEKLERSKKNTLIKKKIGENFGIKEAIDEVHNE